MTTATDLLRAPHIGVRDLRLQLSQRVKAHRPLIITEHGEPKKVLLEYEDMIELVEIMEELHDPEVLRLVKVGRKAVQSGFKGIPVEASFAKLRASKTK